MKIQKGKTMEKKRVPLSFKKAYNGDRLISSARFLGLTDRPSSRWKESSIYTGRFLLDKITEFSSI